MLTLSIIVGVVALATVFIVILCGGAKLGGPEDTRVGGQDLTREAHRAMLADIQAEERRMLDKGA